MPLKDPDALREYRRLYYHRAGRREYQRNVARALRVRLHLLLDGLKAGPCMDCGQTFPPECMDFDHVSGVKVRGVGQMVHISEASLRREIAKCELVCANCHRIRSVARQRATLAPAASQ